MNVDHISIPIALWQFEEVLERRLGQGISIDNLFIVYSSELGDPNPGFYDTKIETKYGKIRFFFDPNCPRDKTYVLHHIKFPYPRLNNNDLFKDGNLIR